MAARRPPISARPAPGAPRRGLPVPVFAGLFIVAGIALFLAVAGDRRGSAVPEVWDAVREDSAAVAALRSEVRPGGEMQGNLLRLEWPEHPNAELYRVRFRDSGGSGPAPVTVEGNVFLYDMKSNALHLPDAFTWEVSAVLPDGSEVVTPRRTFQASMR